MKRLSLQYCMRQTQFTGITAQESSESHKIFHTSTDKEEFGIRMTGIYSVTCWASSL